MKLNYYAETVEISQWVNIDLASSGEIGGIDIDNASKVLDLKELNINKLPVKVVVGN